MTAAAPMLTLFDFAASVPQLPLAKAHPDNVLPLFGVAPPAEPRLRTVARTLAEILADGRAIDRTTLTATMNEIMGGSDAEGAWHPRQAYDCAEAAIVLEVRRRGASAAPDVEPRSALAAMADLKARIPTESRRTGQTDSLQQFSTPPDLAWLAARAARIAPGEVVLEPSAGTGLLAVHAANAGATLILNEIDPDRQTLLALLGRAHSMDARYLAASYRNLDRPTVVLMNPPFSADRNLHGIKAHGTGLRHIEQALMVLAIGGRLVAILGHESDPFDRPDDFAVIAEKAALRASIGVADHVYGRMGVRYGTRLLVFDRGAKAGKVVRPKGALELEDAVAYVDAIAARGNVRSTHNTGSDRRKAVHLGGAATTSAPAHNQTLTIADFCSFGERATVNYEILEPKPRVEGLNEGIFEAYAPTLIAFKGAHPHPDRLVQSSALASVLPPVPTYHPTLPREVITKGLLSEAQLDVITYAGQAHSGTIVQSISDEDGIFHAREFCRGFMNGDGGGVGKGRTTAGIILDNFCKGRTKALWISETQDLAEDAARDWKALGGNPVFVQSQAKFGADATIALPQGILFTTYATLRSASRTTRKSRVDQIVEWLGDDFEGIIAIDESHNASNAQATKGDRGTQAASQQGAAAVELQTRLPQARVVYNSATAATKVSAYSYAPRLGLWGKGTAFPSRSAFVEKISAGGMAAMEVVCRDMSAMGLYIARTLSLADVTYERLIHELTPPQLEQYQTFNHAWRIITANVRSALRECGVTDQSGNTLNGRAVGAALSALESTKQRFYSSVLISMKLPTVIEHARKRLAAGNSVIFQLTNTHEAAMERALGSRDAEDDLDDLDMSPRDHVIDYLKRCFPVAQYRHTIDAEGNERAELMTDAQTGETLINPEAVQLREQLLERFCTMLVPDGPLEMILDAFGVDNVAEITGRKRRVVRRMRDGMLHRVVEERGAHANSAETTAFMSGKKRVLVFSEAGGTGRSYHADRSCGNQQKRSHYLIQAGWRSEKALQGLFRTNRTNQVCAPEYILTTTNVPGERRFISTIARRLDELGALTRGQRDAANAGMFSAADNLETAYGRDALRSLLDDIAAHRVPNLTYENFVEQTGLTLKTKDENRLGSSISMSRFLNRLLACDMDENGGTQALLMDEMEMRIHELITQAIEKGTHDAGVETIKPLALTKREDDVIHTDERSGAITRLLKLEREDYVIANSFRDAMRSVTYHRTYHGTDAAGFFLTDEGTIQAHVPAKETVNGTAQRMLREIGPFHMRIRHPYDGARYTPISDEQAALTWLEQSHAGARKERNTFYCVSGALLPIWDRLPDQMARVYRMQTDAGERILGRVIGDCYLDQVMRNFGRSGAVWDPKTAYERVLKGSPARLASGWTLVRKLLNATPRVEVVVDNPFALQAALQGHGVIVEHINHRLRFFLPSGERGPVVLAAIAGGAPIAPLGEGSLDGEHAA